MATIGIRLANAVLFVMSCSVAAGLISDVGASALIPSRAPAPPAAAAVAPTRQAWQDRQVIVDRNLFGAGESEALAVAVPDEQEDIEESKLPYTLLGTISSDDPRIASAALQNDSTRLHEVVRIGDALSSHGSVTVHTIERRRIVLRNGEKLEALVLDENVDTSIGHAPPPDDRQANRRLARNRRTRATVRDRLEELRTQDGDRSPAAIFSQARILPKYEDGAMVGIELSNIEEGSFYDQVGLQNGDIVVSVNGVAIDNPSATRPVLEAFTGSEEIVADIRDASGATRTITVSPDQLQALDME